MKPGDFVRHVRLFADVPIVVLLVSLSLCGYLDAKPIEGANGHFYEVVTEFNITWHEAELAAAQKTFNGRAGHLATLTSQAENDLIFELIRKEKLAPGHQFWLGGFQRPNQAARDQGWEWINEEGDIPTPGAETGYENWFDYTDIFPGLPSIHNEPNDWPGIELEDGEEDYLAIGLYGLNGWNDVPDAGNWQDDIAGYVIEYDSVKPTIQVRPDSPQSPISARSQGLVQVALYCGDQFQAEEIDIPQVTFGKTGSEATVVKHDMRDLNHDGKTDLLFFFSTPQCGFSEADTIAILRGKLRSGLHFEARDSIRIVK